MTPFQGCLLGIAPAEPLEHSIQLKETLPYNIALHYAYHSIFLDALVSTVSWDFVCHLIPEYTLVGTVSIEHLYTDWERSPVYLLSPGMV